MKNKKVIVFAFIGGLVVASLAAFSVICYLFGEDFIGADPDEDNYYWPEESIFDE